jgi:DHA1 family inner membrane transport protein
MRVVNEAASAPNLASTVNQGAFNFGNATGAWIGGAALTQGLAYDHLAWISVALAAFALILSVYSHWLDGRTRGGASFNVPYPSKTEGLKS